MSTDNIGDYFKYVHKLTVNNFDIYIAVTEYGKLRIGSKGQLQRATMPRFPSWIGVEDAWFDLWHPTTYGHILVHLTIKDNAIWCNTGKDLSPNNKEFPYMFMNKLRYLAIKKKADEIRDKHDDLLRQKRLLNGIDLNR